MKKKMKDKISNVFLLIVIISGALLASICSYAVLCEYTWAKIVSLVLSFIYLIALFVTIWLCQPPKKNPRVEPKKEDQLNEQKK